jgi:hypothetical protein
MTFLNPAVLIGLLAASIPVIIHLLNLKKLKNVEFSTLMFLKELQKNKIRKIKIKQWLLLLLRVLIIIFIVLSFSRPTLKGFNIAGVTSAAKTTSVFLIDNSFSMSVIDQRGSFLNQARDLTEKIASIYQDGDEIFINFIADDSIANSNISSSDFLNSLKSNNISYLKPDLKQNLISAAELINRSKNFNREIFLFTDFQKNLLPSENEKADLSELFNNRVKIYSIQFQKKDIVNLSIDEVKPENQIIQKGGIVSFVATISNHSQQNFQNRVISLFINDKRVAQKSFNINANETQKINIETTLFSDGAINILAEIESDDIEFDNKFYLTINVPEKISILLLRTERTNPDFIKLALQTLPDDKILIDEKNPLQSVTTQISNYDVVILNTDNYGNLNQLKNFVEQGGALIIIPPHKLNFNNFNNIISELGLGKFDSFVSNESKVSLQVEKVDFEHPVFKDLFTNNQQKKIDSPIFTQFMKNSNLIGTTVISLADNSKFLVENKIGKGKVFLFNSAFSTDWSDLTLKSLFAPLIVKSIFYLSQKDFNSFQLKAGEEFTMDINKINSSRIIVKRPDGTEDYFQTNEINSSLFRYTKTNLAGIYSVFAGERLITNFSVNHHASESKMEFLTNEDFEKFLENLNFNGQLIEIKPDENPLEKINQSRFGTELWKLFVFLVIITAVIEMIISRNNKKEIQSLTDSNAL